MRAGLALLRARDLLIDTFEQPLFQPLRGDEEPVVTIIGVADGDVAEERRRVFADLAVCRDDVEIGVLLGGAFVVVARPEMGDVLHFPAFA